MIEGPLPEPASNVEDTPANSKAPRRMRWSRRARAAEDLPLVPGMNVTVKIHFN